MEMQEARRLILESYRHVVSIQTRFADLDPQMHINSIRLAEIFEEARVRFIAAVGYEFRPRATPMFATRINHLYLAEASYPESLDVASAFMAADKNRWTIGQAGFQAGRCVALCEIVVSSGRMAELPFADAVSNLMEKHGFRATSTTNAAKIGADQPR